MDENPVDGAVAKRAQVIRGEKVRMNIWVKSSLFDGMTDIAREEGVSISDVARVAFREHVRRYKARSKVIDNDGSK